MTRCDCRQIKDLPYSQQVYSTYHYYTFSIYLPALTLCLQGSLVHEKITKNSMSNKEN